MTPAAASAPGGAARTAAVLFRFPHLIVKAEALQTMDTNAQQHHAIAAYLEEKASSGGPQPLNPLDHLAYAIMVDAGEFPVAALTALARVRQVFIDWNEVRVSRIQEIARALSDLASPEASAARIREEYNAFFDKKGTLGFDFLAECKVAEGRKLVQQTLPRLRKGAVALLLYEFAPGASFPLSDEGLKAARKNGLVLKNGDRGQLERSLAGIVDKGSVCRLVQHLEIEAAGNPYGEGKIDAGAQAKRGNAPARKKAGKRH